MMPNVPLTEEGQEEQQVQSPDVSSEIAMPAYSSASVDDDGDERAEDGLNESFEADSDEDEDEQHEKFGVSGDSSGNNEADWSVENFARLNVRDKRKNTETTPFIHRNERKILRRDTDSAFGVSHRRPTLKECRMALSSEEELQFILEELLHANAFVSHIEEWILFFFCALSADESILNEDQDSQHEWCVQHLQHIISSTPQRVCPKTFVDGDLVWSCETCQRDATCVLCQDCFMASSHEGHVTYFNTVGTTGGGCCDCGDDQAWDAGGFCNRHGAGSSLESFPFEMQQAAMAVCSYLAQWLSDTCLHLGSIFKTKSDTFFSTEDRFSLTFQRSPETMQQRLLGAQALHNLPLSSLEEIEQNCEGAWASGVSFASARIHFEHVEYRIGRRVAKVAEALLSLCKTSDALVRILCDALTSNHSLNLLERAIVAKTRKHVEQRSGILEDLIVSDPLLPEYITSPLHLLYMRLLTDLAFKERYAVAFAETYVQTTIAGNVSAFRALERDSSVADQGIFGLSVQFLNRENFVSTLIRHYDFIDDIFQCWNYVISSGEVALPPPSLDPNVDTIKYRGYRHALVDTRYIFQASGASRYICFERQDLVRKWLNIIMALQGMDAIERIPSTQPALEFEDESWMYPVMLLINVSPTSLLLLRALSLEDASDWRFAHQPDYPDKLLQFVSIFEDYVIPAKQKLDLNVGNKQVSFSFPVYRFISMGIRGAANACFSATKDKSVCEKILKSISPETCMELATSAMRLLAANAEIKNHMWIRNGFSVKSRSQSYERSSPPHSCPLRDQDIVSLQISAIQLGAPDIVDLGLTAFDLKELLSGSSDEFSSNNSSDREYAPVMCESMLEAFVYCVTEMPRCCTIEGVTPKELVETEVKRYIIHRLAEGALSFSPISDIATSAPEVLKFTETDIRRLVDDICVAKPSTDGMAATVYDLNDNAWRMYDGTFYRQLREGRERARERWLEARRRLKRSSADEILPVCPPFSPYCNPCFVRARMDLLKAIFPVAVRAFILAKQTALDYTPGVPTQWGSCVTFVSLQLMTLLIHASDSTDEFDVWSDQEELIDALVKISQIPPSPPFDEIVHDGVKWIIKTVSSHNEMFARRVQSLSVPVTVGDSEAGVHALEPSEGEKAASSKSVASASVKKTKRNRAQEKAMAAMRAAALQFGEQFAAETDVEEPPTSKTKRNDKNHVEGDASVLSTTSRPVVVNDPDCCICRDSSEKSMLTTLGYVQAAGTFFGNDPNRLVKWSEERYVLTQCGHAMHSSCFTSWRNSTDSQYLDTTIATIEDRTKGEFLCPLCKTVCNTHVPYDSKCNAEVWSITSPFPSDSSPSSYLDSSSLSSPSIESRPLFTGYEFESLHKGATDDVARLSLLDSSSMDASSLPTFDRVADYSKFFLARLSHEHPLASTDVVVERIVSFWTSSVCALLANPGESAFKIRNSIQSALSTATCVPMHLLLDRLSANTSFQSNSNLPQLAPEIGAGISFLALLLVYCTDENNHSNHTVSGRKLLDEAERIFINFLGLKLVQSLIDPLDDGESDSFCAPWDTTGTIEPEILGNAFAQNYVALPVSEAEISLLERSRNAFFESTFASWSEENDDHHPRVNVQITDRVKAWYQSEKWRFGENLVRWTRKQIAPFVELCNSLASALLPGWKFAERLHSYAFDQQAMFTFSERLGREETIRTFLRSKAMTRMRILTLGEAYGKVPHHPLRVRSLVTLPVDYTALFSCAQMGSPCIHCDRPNHEKAVCLICGQLTLAAADCVRTEARGGPCTSHSITEHGGIGVLFLIQRSQVLLVNGFKSALWPSLYVDKNGEDRIVGFQRGLPLKLDARRMIRVQHLFATHAIPHEVSVLRSTSSEGYLRDGLF